MCDTHNQCEGGPVFADITVTPEQMARLQQAADRRSYGESDPDEYEADPDEVAPCLCGEPKPNSKPCFNPDCPTFGGAKRTVTLILEVAARSEEDLPSPDGVVSCLSDALGDEWWHADIEQGEFALLSIGYPGNDEDAAVGTTDA